MKITFLGTSAAEGLPAVWCNCELCKKVRAEGGEEIRTRSQLMIDGRILVDFPMDTYMHALTNRLDLSAIDSVLITHAHMDHCYPQELNLHGGPFAHDLTRPVLTVYCNPTVKDTIISSNAPERREEIASTVPVKVIHPFDRFTLPSGHEITAVPASHTKGEECLVYAIKGDKTALILNDSGPLHEDVYKKLADLGLTFDFISFDCTYGYMRRGEGRHMGALDAADQRDIMRSLGLLSPSAVFYLTHFSHNGGLTGKELTALVSPLGFSVARDSLSVEI